MVRWEELLMHLRAEARRISELAPDTIWYLFGSTLGAFDSAVDIDVMVVCATDQSVVTIRHELREISLRLPLHLFLLTEAEETELRFLATQGCLQLHPSPD